MKIAFHQITSGSKRDLNETFEAYADAGWRHFEVNLWETEEFVTQHGAKSLAALAKDFGLKCVGATGLSIPAFQGGDALEAALKQIERHAQVMNALECTAIVVGGDVPKDFPPRAQNSTENALSARDAAYRNALREFATAVGRVAEVAAKYGVTLALEVNWCGLARSFRTMAELVAMVDRDNVGATWDPAHFYSTPSRLSDLDRLRGKVVHAHLNDIRNCYMEAMDINGDRVLPGDGVLPLVEWTDKIHSLGYRGWHCVELFSDDLWAEPLREIATRTKKACEHVWPNAEF
ncbi:MAG TPA: sugar phosphate isomerase/epimerase family protein [Candidatus Latescibacteria bacterium]|nr:sugar phosphate isomerase/epimerase family protein [Candidatus Latescibacterota bacterium]